MIRLTIITLVAAVVFASCKQDGAAVDNSSEPSTETSSSSQTEPPASMMEVNGFNFLTACDSLVVSKLVLSGPDGEGDYAYVKGDCATGKKSYELLLVPRSGAVPAAQFGDPTKVLAEAAATNYKDYICYAFELPKHQKVNSAGQLEIVDLFPINAVIKRLDNSNWVRLGQDRAEDLSGYNTLRWNILHDNMPQYN